MARNTRNIYCPNCRVSAPRDLSELARSSGRTCLVCGWRLPAECVWSADSALGISYCHRYSPNELQLIHRSILVALSGPPLNYAATKRWRQA
jgi:hypothetical protein